MRIGIDIMGGDYYPHAPVRGILDARKQIPADVEIVFIGDKEVIAQALEKEGEKASDFSIVHAAEMIRMDEHPARAITTKTQSSINIGIHLNKTGQLDAFISAGNTGAMLVGAVLGLGAIEGVIRPTVGAWFPCREHRSLLCDVGANVECKPEQLYQFGLLGSIFMQKVKQIQKPRIALLNVGEEKTKGTPIVQQAHALFEQNLHNLNFVGNAEGRHINDFVADVYVTDGFTGNIVLKYGESMYHLLKPKLPNDPDVEGYNFESVGSVPILGVKGNIMVGHGISGPLAFQNMIFQAIRIVQSQLTLEITKALNP